MANTRKILVVVKDVVKTQFMQACDMFEKNKFVGIRETLQQNATHSHVSAETILERFSQNSDQQKYQVVGVIIPDADACFLPKHEIISDGNSFVTIEQLCETYNAKLKQLSCTL